MNPTEQREITLATASAEDINEVIRRIAPVVEGLPEHHVIMAMISILLMSEHPDLDAHQMVRGVAAVSKFICTWGELESSQVKDLSEFEFPSNLVPN